MCTFCGRNHNETPSTKTISVYGKGDKYLGYIEVPYSWSVNRYQEGLWRKFPDWKYTK